MRTSAMETQPWTDDKSRERLGLEVFLVSLSKDLAVRLEVISQGLQPVHRATAEWIQQLSTCIANAVETVDAALPDPHRAHAMGAKQASRVSNWEFANRMRKLSEMAQPLIRADYVKAEDRGRLAQLLESVGYLTQELHGLTEHERA